MLLVKEIQHMPSDGIIGNVQIKQEKILKQSVFMCDEAKEIFFYLSLVVLPKLKTCFTYGYTTSVFPISRFHYLMTLTKQKVQHQFKKLIKFQVILAISKLIQSASRVVKDADVRKGIVDSFRQSLCDCSLVVSS